MRRLLPLLLALVVLATALPALAAKPAPDATPTGECVVSVATNVPKGGKRVAAVTFAGQTWEGDRFLNGQSHTFLAVVSGPGSVELQMLDHRGIAVYELSVPVDCTVPKPSAG